MLGIDMGSNTLRAVLMDENFNKLKSEEFIIGAAKNMQNDTISDEAIERIFSALKILKEKNYNLSQAKAVATAAFRKAKNTKLIFEKIQKEFKLDIKLIDAKTEAKLSILGMQERLKALKLFRKDLSYCDLGGASCEISNDKFSKSYDFGIISFYERMHFKAIKPSVYVRFFKKYPQNLVRIKDEKLKIHLSPYPAHLKQLALKAFNLSKDIKLKGNFFILNSGVPTTLCAYKQNIKYKDYLEESVNGKILKRKDFFDFALKIWNLEQEKAKIYLGENRKKYLIAGSMILFALFNKQKLIVIDDGVREGVCIAHFKNIKF
ncbi:Ppx/GppA family phosphatase [Campylobacter lari]|uniref:Ppx/GppA phosphatase family protein n=1 Tax=unclassified Campylobacter TaxID=2593542 RepID=UPI00128A0297|nr:MULTISPECIES: Ppx/GppA family phosphatase [unclassified Campylobacter]EAK0817562.1 Ppx/GppA family phosphatase [Campylobacter lari]EAK9890147.1 Ppx/GppA family phosphatase [Campylobacter lari]EDP6879311.1 Ppx/GppA family phosphatase [Campylobacter lari]EGK8024890.1 Ppx/GppA family phosphatase [Campylobacter lari]EGK8129033.1 Ppx/GppA family phosphatase [Campylobacter lari]